MIGDACLIGKLSSIRQNLVPGRRRVTNTNRNVAGDSNEP